MRMRLMASCRYWVLITAIATWVGVVGAVPPPGGVAPVTVPAGGFSIDGDLLAGVPWAGAGDWLAGTNGPACGVLDVNGKPLNPATTFHFVDPYNSSADNSFVGGLKWGDDPNTWQWTTGKPSAKTDINNVLMHIATDAAGQVWVILAVDRASMSGDSYVDFEFLQNTLILTNNGKFVSSGPDGGRTVNDLLLSLAFTSGGSVADFFAWRWVTNGSGGFAYRDVTASLPAGGVFVAANSNSTAVPYGAFGQTTYGPNAFAEAAVDLTALLGNFDPCLSLGINSIMVKTKSSQSASATIIDFIDPIQYTMKFGPSANAGPDQTQCFQGASTAFSLQGKATQGLRPNVSTNWTVIAGVATLDDPGSLSTTVHVTSDTATLRLTVASQDGCTETDDVVLRVAPLPVCAIAGSALVCPQSTNSFAGPAGMARYAWSVSGNGSILGSTNSPVVSVRAGSDCGASFALGLTVVSNGCSSTCELPVVVNDVNPPTITAPPDRLLECPADTRTNATGVASAQDDCGRVSVTYTDSVTNGSGNTVTIARTWVATDLCGNAASAVQMITVRDTTAPRITAPANRILECPADTGTNNTGVATAQDGCGPTAISYSDSVSNACGGTKVISRLWTAVDASGNSASALQTITVRDTTPPTITAPPSLTLECPADAGTNATGVAVAQDTCGQVTITFSDSVSNSCGAGQVIRRTWSAADECGNRATALQTITVRDTTAPAITPPPDLVLECPADTRTNATGVATAQDACSTVSFSFSDSVSNSCGGTKVIARTWTATDACGNHASAVQRITVRDTTPPTITAPPNLTLECPANTGTNATGVAMAQDGCGTVTISYSDSVSNSCGGAKVISRTWLATDACGNAASAAQVITVRDTTPPTITAPPNLTLECPANTGTNATGVAVAQDGCGAVTITYSDVVSNSCGGTKGISRTWIATDACGNSASALQKITVRDTTPPTITAPPNLTLECPADTGTNATGVAVAQDGCGAVAITYSDVVSNSCGGTKVISRTWLATDACGNSISALQRITVRDTTPPTITAPPNLTLECPANTGTNATGVATAQDGCGAVTIAYSDVVSNSCGGTKVVFRTWLATDACGNSISALQRITVRDTTPPTITAPPNLTLECPANTGTNATGVAVAQDGCGSVTINYSDSVSNSCGGAKVISRTWRATDACGNQATAVQTLTVRDTTPPTIAVPADLVLECPADTRTNATGVATGQDGCGAVAISYSDVVSNSCGGAKLITRTWTVADGCGNSVSGVQRITVRDTAPPSFQLPANRVLECPGDTRTNVTGVPIAIDGCGAVTVTYSDVVSNSCGLTRTIWRLWTAADGCGNSTNGVQTITVVDTTKPTITCPAIQVQCPGDVPAPYADLAAFLAAGGKASDTCGTTLALALISDSGLAGSCPGTVTRVYRLTDACGNFTEATQVITVRDTIAPVITCPTNRTVECGLALTPANTGAATATDNCDTNVNLSYTDAIVPSEYNIKFYAADPDTGAGPYAPTYLKLAPGSLPCPQSALLTGRAIDPLRNAVAYASTNGQLDALTSMGGAPMRFGQVVPFEVVILASGGPGMDHGTIEVTANWSTHTTSNDQFGYDTNYMVYCAFVDIADPGLVDPNLNARVESYSSKVVNAGTINEQIQGTFRVSGLDSGDRVVVEIWLVLMSAPPGNFGGTIASELVSAQKASVPPEPITIGNQTVSIGNLSKIMPLPPPQEQPPAPPPTPQPSVPPGITVSIVDRTWTATDTCANHSSCVQRITVRDTGPPALVVPPDAVLECPADTSTNQTGTATALAVCTSATITYSDSVTNNADGTKVIARTWTATDAAGDTTNAVQRIVVRDTTPPTLTVPPDQVLEYPAGTGTNATGAATASDGCGTAIVTFSDSVSNTCGLASVVWRTWTATDSSGNTTSAVQTIAVRDTTPPTLVAPSDRTVQASSSWNFDEPAAADNCGAVTVLVVNTVTNLAGTNTLVATRTWLATDACGNASPTRQQNITVILPPPVIPPTITEQPVCRATASGTGASLSVTATGTGPLSYQWRFNGSNIAGATGSTLTLANLQFTNAGLYSVVVSNSAGVAVSSPAIVNVAPQICAQLTANGLQLSWPAPFILQAAPAVSGPFTDVAGASSAYLQNTASPMRFFRLRSPTYDVIVSYNGAGAAGLTVNGPPGWNFIIQASSDYANWVNLATNTAPCTYVDDSASLYKFRTYRVVLTAPTGTAAAPIAAATITGAPLGQTATWGGGTTLSVTASGAGPLAYQWRLNGTNIAGATTSTLNLANLQFRDAGYYSVTVSNAGGVVTSTAAVVNVAPRLSWQQVADGLQLSWPSPYILQCAKNAAGPYADVPGAASPFLQTTAGPRKFFRLRATPGDVIVTPQPNGAATLSLVGAPGWNYVVQASSDYTHWVDLFTGTAPATYLDSTAGQYPVRVYRAVSVQ